MPKEFQKQAEDFGNRQWLQPRRTLKACSEEAAGSASFLWFIAAYRGRQPWTGIRSCASISRARFGRWSAGNVKDWLLLTDLPTGRRHLVVWPACLNRSRISTPQAQLLAVGGEADAAIAGTMLPVPGSARRQGQR